MRGFITGAPGVLGHRLVDCGYEVIGLSRDGEGNDIVEHCGRTPKRGDGLGQGIVDGEKRFRQFGMVRVT